MDIVEQQIEALELHTNALQILLGKSPHPLAPTPNIENGWATGPSRPPSFWPLELPVPRSLVTIFKFHPAGPRCTPHRPLL